MLLIEPRFSAFLFFFSFSFPLFPLSSNLQPPIQIWCVAHGLVDVMHRGPVFRVYPFANTLPSRPFFFLFTLFAPSRSLRVCRHFFAFDPSSLLPLYSRSFRFLFFFHLSPRHFFALHFSSLFQPCSSFSAIAFNIRKGRMRQILQRSLNRLHDCDILHDLIFLSRCKK